MKNIKINSTLDKKTLVSALGKGVRDAAISKGNGGYERQTNIHISKKYKTPKYKNLLYE